MERDIGELRGEAIVETALHLQKEIARSTQNAQMGYIPDGIDIVAVLGHKSTFLNSQFYKTENWSQFMDNDRVTQAAYLWHQISKHQTIKNHPLFVYTGSPQECNVISNCHQQNLLGIPKDRLHIINKVTRENSRQNHINTADNIEAMFQDLTSEDSSLLGKNKIVVVSNLGHFIRIPFYIEHYRLKYDPNFKIKFYPYGVPERPEARKPFVENEVWKLTEYLKQGFLSPQPVQFSFFGSN